MTRPRGNTQLKAARQAAGYSSQEAFAGAIKQAAQQLGIRGLSVSVRQIRRWESTNPPWPQPDHQRLLVHLLGQSMEELGFTPPWGEGAGHSDSDRRPGRQGTVASAVAAAAPMPNPNAASQPATVGADFAAITAAHRRLYWSVQPAQLHPTVMQHAQLGACLLNETTGPARTTLSAALAESYLLAGRIEFFDLQEPDDASSTLVRALQAAGEADDSLLGAAILAHTAFIPGWAGRKEDADERMSAARAYARRRDTPAMMWAWLDAVEAECETHCGDTRTALQLIAHAEDTLAQAPDEERSPVWMDWFTPIRLAAFKGNTQLVAGHIPQARETLRQVLNDLPAADGKQRTIILGDLAAVEAAAENIDEACRWAEEALDQLAATWYAAGMGRVREVRRKLQPWQHEPSVRQLDDHMYGWGATVSALQR